MGGGNETEIDDPSSLNFEDALIGISVFVFALVFALIFFCMNDFKCSFRTNPQKIFHDSVLENKAATSSDGGDVEKPRVSQGSCSSNNKVSPENISNSAEEKKNSPSDGDRTLVAVDHDSDFIQPQEV